MLKNFRKNPTPLVGLVLGLQNLGFSPSARAEYLREPSLKTKCYFDDSTDFSKSGEIPQAIKSLYAKTTSRTFKTIETTGIATKEDPDAKDKINLCFVGNDTCPMQVSVYPQIAAIIQSMSEEDSKKFRIVILPTTGSNDKLLNLLATNINGKTLENIPFFVVKKQDIALKPLPLGNNGNQIATNTIASFYIANGKVFYGNPSGTDIERLVISLNENNIISKKSFDKATKELERLNLKGKGVKVGCSAN